MVILMSRSGQCFEEKSLDKNEHRKQLRSVLPLRDDADYADGGDDQSYYGDLDAAEENSEGGLDAEKEEEEPIRVISPRGNSRPMIVEELPVVVPKAKPASTASSGFPSMCPIKCSCLGDFMDCANAHLKDIPRIPDWVHSL